MHGDIGLGIDMAPLSRNAPSASSKTKRSHEPDGRQRSPSKADAGSASRKRRPVALEESRSSSSSASETLAAMRSSRVMEGLVLAERGASMVEMDKLSGTVTTTRMTGVAKFTEDHITSSNHSLYISPSKSLSTKGHRTERVRRGLSVDEAYGLGLPRHSTLLSIPSASPLRRAEQLSVLLGDSSAKVKSGAVISSQSADKVVDKKKGKSKSKSRSGFSPDPEAPVVFEQGRSHARVSLDLELENNVAVEGGFISGTLLVHVRPKKKDELLRLGGGKLRIAGFEVAPKNEDRCIFYQVAAPLMDASDGCDGLFVLPVDEEGFGLVEEGEYSVRFSLKIPLISPGGKPRGVLNSRSGATIKYIIIASMKVFDPTSNKRSIAHFYRECEIWPALDISTTLAPAPDPMRARAAKKLFMGGDGVLALTASLHRITWIAGQPVHVRLRVVNETKKTVRGVCLALVRTTTLYKSAKSRNSGGAVKKVEFEDEMDEGETCTNERKVAESVLVAGQKAAKGRASAKGWWAGVGPGETSSVTPSLTLPADALTIPRARLVEVDYAVRVALIVSSLAGNSEAVHVTLPIRIVNFISLDPPPCGPVLPPQPSSTSISVIELDTPKQESYFTSTSDISMRDKYGREDYPEHRGYVKHGKKTPRLRDMPVGKLSTAHTVHDLGSVEDVEDLDGMLGDIPGSVSILEEADISLSNSMDSGYSEGCSISSCSFNGFDHHDRTGSGYSPCGQDEYNFESYGEDQSLQSLADEDVGSDEELERMVGCASARVGTGSLQHANAANWTTSSVASGSAPYSSQTNHVGYTRPSGRQDDGARARAVRGPRTMVAPARRSVRVPEPEREGGDQRAYHAMTPPQGLHATRSMLHVTNFTESPESMYSSVNAGSAAALASVHALPSPSKRLRFSVPKSQVAVQDSQTRGIHPRSNLSTSPTRIIANASTSSSGLRGITSTPSSVRSRIAALEQKTFEQEELTSGHDYECGVGQGYVSRSLTMGAVASYA